MSKLLTPTAVAIGNFDGLHLGHQKVIQPILDSACHAQLYDESRQLSSDSANVETNFLTSKSKQLYKDNFEDIPNFLPTVLTFNPHPREFFSGKLCESLTPFPEKVQQLLRFGVKQVLPLTFNRELANLNPQQFVEKILVEQLNARLISVGQDFCFGSHRSGTAEDLQAIASDFGICVNLVPPYTYNGERISSTAIRQALKQGDIQKVTTMLGRFYTLTGLVVEGQEIDRAISYPTANLQLPLNKLLPPYGIYAVKVLIENDCEQEWKFHQMKNFAHPSELSVAYEGIMEVSSSSRLSSNYQFVKVHLLDWSGNLYGKTLTLHIENLLLPEQKLSSLKDFKCQISAEYDQAMSVLI
ncbi:riboflavin biosynthesis protein RibF [Nostoc sp. NIES-4103]|nr:riboflavin biosynthesis protein RibF [Nostoc sp. NIES-4103]